MGNGEDEPYFHNYAPSIEEFSGPLLKQVQEGSFLPSL